MKYLKINVHAISIGNNRNIFLNFLVKYFHYLFKLIRSFSKFVFNFQSRENCDFILSSTCKKNLCSLFMASFSPTVKLCTNNNSCESKPWVIMRLFRNNLQTLCSRNSRSFRDPPRWATKVELTFLWWFLFFLGRWRTRSHSAHRLPQRSHWMMADVSPSSWLSQTGCWLDR